MTLAELIHAQGLTGQNYPAIAAVLNAQPYIDNPEPQGTITLPITLAMVMSKATEAELDGFYASEINKAILDDVKAAIDSKNPTYQGAMLGVAMRKNLISQATAAKMQALISGTDPALTVPDPNWQATVLGDSIAQAAGLGVVTAADVQAADQLTGGAGLYANPA